MALQFKFPFFETRRYRKVYWKWDKNYNLQAAENQSSEL